MAPPPDERIRWQVLRRETVYTSPWVSLHRDWVRLPDGSLIEGHHVLEYPYPAVGVVATDTAGRVMLVDHDRFISQERSWEIPSGRVEVDESWETAARRELLEESGCTSADLTYLGRYRPSIGSTNQLFVLYYAPGVTQTASITDTNEIIAARWFDVAEVLALIAQDAMPDGMSLTALLLALHKGYLQ